MSLLEDTSTNVTDEELMAQLSVNPEVYGVIIDRYTNKLTRYIKRISGINGDELDDVLQDIFVKAYEKSASFDTDLSFNSWIYRIAHNTTVNYWKKNRRYKEGVSFDEDSESTKAFLGHVLADDSTYENIMRGADIELIKDALSKLKEKYRSILILRFYEEQDYGEISDVLQIPLGTVATHLHRAKKALAKQVTLLEQPKEK